MIVLGKHVLTAFESKYAPARKAFLKWRQVVEQAEWSSQPDVKATFALADYVAPYYVFNVGGNKYRIIAKVEFTLKLVQIMEALTHEKYSD